MKALTISQPFATLIASGQKWVENRSWETHYRGQLLIHAGKGTQYLTASQLKAYPNGCIIAVANLARCLNLGWLRQQPRERELTGLQISVGEILNHQHTEGPWCWVLRDIRSIESVRCSGAQGLWEPADNILQQIKAQLPAGPQAESQAS